MKLIRWILSPIKKFRDNKALDREYKIAIEKYMSLTRINVQDSSTHLDRSDLLYFSRIFYNHPKLFARFLTEDFIHNGDVIRVFEWLEIYKPTYPMKADWPRLAKLVREQLEHVNVQGRKAAVIESQLKDLESNRN